MTLGLATCLKMTVHTFICLASPLLMVVLSKSLCDASSLTVPRNSVAIIGERVELKCRTDVDEHVIWGFTSFNTSEDTDIYFGDNISSPFQSRYKIDNRISGQHNLVIESIDLDHAGRYQCVTIATSNKAVAHLTVLGSSPECSADTNRADDGVMENGYLWIWCRIDYAGNMIPILIWTKTNTEDAIASNTSTSAHDNRTVGLLMTTTSSVIRQLYSDDNGVIFKCKIRFKLRNNSEEKAPDYEYTWYYTANVLYGPSNLSIVQYEDRLECSADGNPTPTYSWIYVETNRSVDDPVLILDKEFFSDKERNVECTAVNALGTQKKSIPHSNKSNNDVGSTSDPGTSRRTVVAAAVGGGSLLLLLIMITVSCFVRRKKLKGLTRIHVSFIGRSVSVEPDIIDVDIYSYGSNAFRVLENHGRDSESIPVYAEVKKGNGQKERERTRTDCSAPVYADVKMKKKAKESLNSNSTAAYNLSDDNSPSPQVSIQKKKRQNRVGADGTEYLDISEVRQPFDMSTTRAATQPAFNRTNYAFIDHTARVPPPPPKF